MAGLVGQDFLRGSADRQRRTLTLAGLSTLAVLGVIVALTWLIYPRATAPQGTAIHLVLPSLGPGIKTGSSVLLRGAEVGEVTGVSAPSADDVRVDVVLDQQAAAALTDTMDVDFRPANYFGITGVNLIAGSGGQPLRDGQTISRTQAPDFTMSTMLERGSIVVDGTLTNETIATLDKVMAYADGLSPLIHTGVIVTDKVARTQRELPSTLLSPTNDILEAFPAFNEQTMASLYAITESPYNQLPDGSRGVDDSFHKLTDKSLTIAADDLFGRAGALLASHADQLTPLTTLVTYLTDPLPRMIGGGATMAKTTEAVKRLQASFTGTDEQKTLQLRVVLDSLPAVQSQLRATGVTRAGVATPKSPAGGN